MKIIITAAMLAVVSLIFQFTPFTFLPTASGMRLDLVAVPWIVAALLLGPLGAAITVVVSYLVIAFGAATGFFGATIKLIASLPLVVVFALIAMKFKKPTLKILLAGLILAIIVRIILAHTVNYYVTFPAFQIPVDATLNELLPFLTLPYAVSWLAVIDFLNVIQSLIEFVIVYLVVFRTKLWSRFHAFSQ